MRIYGGRGKSGLGFVNVYLVCSNPTINNPIRLYIDTGASRTTIADRDATKFGLNYTQLQQSSIPIIGIGCKTVKNYTLKNVLLIFKTVGGSYHMERLEEVTVLEHQPQTPVEKAIVDRIPSLLGVDVVGKYRIRFTKKRVVLEK